MIIYPFLYSFSFDLLCVLQEDNRLCNFYRNTAFIPHGNFSFCIRAQPFWIFCGACNGNFPSDRVREHQGQRQKIFTFLAGIAQNRARFIGVLAPVVI